jgi:hypothetical protein
MSHLAEHVSLLDSLHDPTLLHEHVVEEAHLKI